MESFQPSKSFPEGSDVPFNAKSQKSVVLITNQLHRPVTAGCTLAERLMLPSSATDVAHIKKQAPLPVVLAMFAIASLSQCLVMSANEFFSLGVSLFPSQGALQSFVPRSFNQMTHMC